MSPRLPHWPALALLLPLLLPIRPVMGQSAGTPIVSQAADPMLQGFRWRSIGPVGQGGRVDDFAVNPKDASEYYIGFATGGIWKTTNGGTTFTAIFDSYQTHSIGDLALAPSNPQILYVGTGEPNNRQSSSFGYGMYRSNDGGQSFAYLGLEQTQSIARVVVHPTNPDIVWVAAMGHLFGPNDERGVYKSSDGGRSWRRVLFVDQHTGATDLVIHPTNPQILWAATYQRQRTAFGFASGGPGSGIWKSANGGETWTRVSGAGLPAGTMGRIGLDISGSNPQVIYAQIEVGPDKEPPATRGQQEQGGQGGGGGGQGQQNLPPDDKVSGVWRSTDGGQRWEFRSNQNNRPMYYSQIRVDPSNENIVFTGGAPAFKSTDGGKEWKVLQGMGHVDHHAIWIDPADGRHVMYGNDGSVDLSRDGGDTWESLRILAVGQPYHASVDMRRPYYVCTGLQDNGSWCGPSSVRSGTILAQDWYRVGGGDGFYTAVDPTDHMMLFSESQGGNMNRVDLRAGETSNIRPRFGTGGSNVAPTPAEGTQVRWNWNTPLVLSPHNPQTVLAGANRLFISRNRGETWTMSQDLTRQIDRNDRSIIGLDGTLPSCSRARAGQCILSKNDGVSVYGTVTAISESPLVPGLIWVGTDDGNIQVSQDGGASWTEVGRNLPGGAPEYYVSRVEASWFDAATAYVSLDGHRSDDLKPYVFVTRDHGKSWQNITSDLPAMGNVNTVRQDPKSAKVLYAGAEFGFFVSLDEGGSWKPFMTNLPVVRIDDVVIHPRDNDLILSTHGRSIWIMDDVTALQQLAEVKEDVHLFQPREAVAWKSDILQRRSVTGSKNFQGESAPAGTAVSYLLKTSAKGVKITITDLASGEVFRTMDGSETAGMNRVQWNLCSDRRPATPGQGFVGGGGGGGACGGGFGGGGGQGGIARQAEPGIYRVTLTVGGKDYTRNVTVLKDDWMR
jgi:photosystem II stability/assembly factor-like uncharacterized protein